MPKPKDRTKNRKFVRVPSGETRVRYFKGKASKRKCGLCGNKLHGVPHGRRNASVKKLRKSERRPEVMFGGVLCGNCREKVVKETTKTKYFEKKLEELI